MVVLMMMHMMMQLRVVRCLRCARTKCVHACVLTTPARITHVHAFACPALAQPTLYSPPSPSHCTVFLAQSTTPAAWVKREGGVAFAECTRACTHAHAQAPTSQHPALPATVQPGFKVQIGCRLGAKVAGQPPMVLGPQAQAATTTATHSRWACPWAASAGAL